MKNIFSARIIINFCSVSITSTRKKVWIKFSIFFWKIEPGHPTFNSSKIIRRGVAKHDIWWYYVSRNFLTNRTLGNWKVEKMKISTSWDTWTTNILRILRLQNKSLKWLTSLELEKTNENPPKPLGVLGGSLENPDKTWYVSKTFKHCFKIFICGAGFEFLCIIYV